VISFVGKQICKYAKEPLGTFFFGWCLLYSQAMPRAFVHPTNTKYKSDLTKVDYLLSIILSKLDLCATTFAGSRRVLTTAMDDWSENLFALAPVRAYAYVQ
jgi:hypothetical protein